MFAQVFALIIFDALILCASLYLLAKHEADCSFAKCAMVVSPIVVAPVVIAGVLFEHLAPLLVMIAVPLILVPFAIFMVTKFCWVGVSKAILVVALFYTGHLALNLGIAAMRREFQKPVKRIEPEKTAGKGPEETKLNPSHSSQPRKQAAPVKQVESSRTRLLNEARARMENRLSVHRQIAALCDIVANAQDVTVTSIVLHTTVAPSRVDGQLRFYLSIPSKGEQAVVWVLEATKNNAAFQEPWRVAVESFAADTSPDADRRARTAVILCDFRDKERSMETTTSKGGYSEVFVKTLQSAILAPRSGSYLLPARELIEKQAKASRITTESVLEIGILQSPTDQSGAAINTYSVRMTGNAKRCSSVAQLVKVLEQDPFTQIRAVNIKTDPRTREMEISMDVQLPIWRDTNKAEAILKKD